MQARHLLSLALALVAGAGCSPDSQPTEPAVPAAPVDMSGAFQLTIDVASGRVTVTPPRSPAAAMRPGPGALASSVLGSEAIALHAGNCSFSSIAGNSRQKRCTMQVAIENRLELVDLVTPTTFPKPPQGEGLLVFPYTAAALGVPGGGAVPNALWDEAPINFFNDFGGCAGGKTGDCYRWERYSSPLAAGETSAARSVGFDVDKAAQSVSIYILVAADVRDAAPKTVSLTPVEAGCGTAGSNSNGEFAVPGTISGICGGGHKPWRLHLRAAGAARGQDHRVRHADPPAERGGCRFRGRRTCDRAIGRFPSTDARQCHE